MRRISVGIVGTGFAASAHIEALRRIAGVHIVAIAASNKEKATSAAARYGIERAHGDYRAMLDVDVVAVVHNCTPNNLHADINDAVLRSGKHLLCEKPLGMNSEETARLAAAASRAPVMTGVCFNYRHFPLVRQAKEMLSSGRYGNPHLVHGGYLQDWLLHDDDWNWRLESERAGASRAVADIGSHWLDLVEYVTGDRVARVFADLAILHPERLRPGGEVETFQQSEAPQHERRVIDTEDMAVVTLRFSSGCVGALTVSQVSPGRKNRLTWEIDTGSVALAWDQEDPNRLWIGRRDGSNEEIVRDPSLLGPEAASLAHYPAGHQEGWPDGLKNLMLDFYAAVDAHDRGEQHEASFATFAEADHVTRVVEAIVESSRSGAWVDVKAGGGRT